MPVPTFTVQRGELRATLFENLRVGVPRGIYWSCSIDFAAAVSPTEQPAHDTDAACTLLCDWISWPVRCWRQIDGLTLASCRSPPAVEASLYFAGEHQWLTVVELSFQRTQADRWHVTGRFCGDLLDEGGDRFRGAGAEFGVEMPFAGISVLPDNVRPKLKSAAGAAAALGEFADLASYEAPIWDDICWLFRPKLGAAL